jgi:hypothetical protein
VSLDKKTVQVIDPSGSWSIEVPGCGRGDLMRLPHTVHPSAKPLALKYFAEKSKRQNELVDVEGMTVATCGLFEDFCESLVEDSGLVPMQGTAVDIAACDTSTIDGFEGAVNEVVLEDGRRVKARAVVVSSSSAGHGIEAVVPHWWSAEGKTIVRKRPSTEDKSRHIAIIGGGMTAATEALKILNDEGTEDCNTQVTLIARRPLLKRVLDVEQGWWGSKYLHSYHALPSDGKAKMLACRRARARGSVAPRVLDDLLRDPRVRVLQGVDVQELCVGEDGMILRIARHPELPKGNQSDVAPGNTVDVRCDEVRLACGTAFNVATNPVLRNVCERYPVSIIGGYPVLREDCSWSESFRSIYVAGRGAMVTVGPCGGNVVGMRMSAERISSSILGGANNLTNIESDRPGEISFDPVQRVTEWTLVDGVAVVPSSDDCTFDIPLESSNSFQTHIPLPDSKLYDPLDPSRLPEFISKKEKVDSYSFVDEGFRLSVIVTFPEPIARDKIRTRVTMTSLESWYLGCDTAYHLYVPRLYGKVIPERTSVVVKEEKNRVTFKLHKEKDAEWKYLRG